MTAEQILDLIAPQFIDDPNKLSFLTLACNRTSQAAFRTNYAQAIALRAAHMMTLAQPKNRNSAGAGGSISSMSEGDLSISFATNPNNAKYPDLNSTAYGRQLIELISGAVVGIAVTSEV